jgi:hypothetical protein
MEPFWFGIIVVAICFPLSNLVVLAFFYGLTQLTKEELDFQAENSDGFGCFSVILLLLMFLTPLWVPVKYDTEVIEPTEVTKFTEKTLVKFEYDNEFHSKTSHLVDIYKADEHQIVVERYRNLFNKINFYTYELEAK